MRLEICYLHTAPLVKVLNQASPQHLSTNETLSLHLYVDENAKHYLLVYCGMCVHLQSVFDQCFFFFLLNAINLEDCSVKHTAADLESVFDILMS